MPYTTCIRCSQVMVHETADGLCETCHRIDTARPAFLAGPGYTPYLITPAVEVDSRALTPPYGLPATPLPVLPGYRLMKVLGGGGMGVVFLAHEAAAARLVALKLVRAYTDPDARARFASEIQAKAQLDHPNVVRVYSVVLDRPEPFFTMEYVDGPGLDRRLVESGPLPVDEAVWIMEQVARGVQHAHDRDVIHRDLKPGNVVVGSDGVAKVTDFGLAKRIDVESGLTVSKAILGTPGFMAPEQTGGQNDQVGKLADVYGLGSTLYALLTGHPPFHGPDPVAVAVQVRTQRPVPPSQLRRDVPAALEAVILKCLAKDPARRYASAGDLADDLGRISRRERPIHARPPSAVVRAAKRLARPAQLMGTACLVALFTLPVGPMNPVQLLPAATDHDPRPQLLKEWKKDRPISLIGTTCQPGLVEPLTGPVTIAPSPTGDRTWYVESVGHRLVKLFDPGGPAYHVELELQLVQALAPLAEVGVFAGYERIPMPDGKTTHSYLSLGYRDVDPNFAVKPTKQIIRFDAIYLNHPQGKNPLPHKLNLVGDRFSADGALPGPWRKVVFDVNPERVVVQWEQNPGKNPRELKTFAGLTGGEIRQMRRDDDALRTREAIKENRDFIPPPNAGYVPEGGFGVWVSGSGLAVRNVVVTPTR